MSDAHGVARDQLRAFIERIERLEAEKAAIASDIKDVKAEAKAMGFDIGAINTIVKLRKKDAEKRAEEEQVLDTYMIALGMLPEPFEQEEDYDRETGEVFDIPASNGEKAVRPELAANSVGEIAASHSPSEDGAIAAVKGKARLANVADVEPSSSVPTAPASHGEAEVPSHEANEGDADEAQRHHEVDICRRHVPIEESQEANEEESAHAGTVATAPVFAATHRAGGVSKTPATKHPVLLLRPHCQHPGEEICPGSGKNHCRACAAAIREEEVA